MTGSERNRSADQQQLAELCDQAAAFARSLTGPLRRVAVRQGSAAVEVDWHEPQAGAETAPATVRVAPTADVVEGPGVRGAVPPDTRHLHVVTAPLVGTFYRSPAPGEDPYVTPGTTVTAGQTLGIVEAMKLLNPIVADVDGQVEAVLVDDAEYVEFEQPLVRIAPSQVQGDAGDQTVARAG
jgi:acetyl-CoA carboxylase biotin carboxyl carrier protein